MARYFIVARVNGIEYLTKVEAESEYAAEHMILDRGVYGAGEYSCDACMAYDAKMMKTDTFIGAAMFAEPVSADVLLKKIDENNERLLRKEAKQKEIAAMKKAIAAAQEKLDEMRRSLEEANLEYAGL